MNKVHWHSIDTAPVMENIITWDSKHNMPRVVKMDDEGIFYNENGQALISISNKATTFDVWCQINPPE
jgi:hypothetical protein